MKARKTVVTGFFGAFVCTEDCALGHDYRFPFHSNLWIKQSRAETKQTENLDRLIKRVCRAVNHWGQDGNSLNLPCTIYYIYI